MVTLGSARFLSQLDMQDGRGGIDFKCLCTSENIRRKRLYSKEDGCFQSNSNLVRKVITLSNKVYVDVLAEFSKDGLLIPKEITWEDGRKYEITRVKDKRRAASTRAGGVGERYTCVVDGKEIFLLGAIFIPKIKEETIMKRKIAYTFITSALVMSAFLIGKTMSTQKIVEPKPNAKQYLVVNDIQSIDY